MPDFTYIGVRAYTIASDKTRQGELDQLFTRLREWAGRLDALVLNASGGLERDLVAADPAYPRRLNRDAQLAVVEGALPLLGTGGTIVFVTSHWAHLYGQVEQLPAYEPVAATKREGEAALRDRQPALAAQGIRLLVVTGDLVEGTITPKLLARAAGGQGGSVTPLSPYRQRVTWARQSPPRSPIRPCPPATRSSWGGHWRRCCPNPAPAQRPCPPLADLPVYPQPACSTTTNRGNRSPLYDAGS